MYALYDSFFIWNFFPDEERSEWKLIEARLDARCALVKKYVDTNIEREKQVLFALQHLMDEMEHPNSKFLFLKNITFLNFANRTLCWTFYSHSPDPIFHVC